MEVNWRDCPVDWVPVSNIFAYRMQQVVEVVSGADLLIGTLTEYFYTSTQWDAVRDRGLVYMEG